MSALPPKPYGIGSRGRSPAPGSETNTIDQIQIRNTIMIYSIPIETGGKRCLNHIIHQFHIHTHWIILSILLILSINTINNLFFLFYIHIVVIRYVLCIRYIPSIFSHNQSVRALEIFQASRYLSSKIIPIIGWVMPYFWFKSTLGRFTNNPYGVSCHLL